LLVLVAAQAKGQANACSHAFFDENKEKVSSGA
jgi:hypothetical protein